ncbi:MAG: alcohol dehydrogenase catalytic domain-containing protein [Nitrospinota bacterium]
MLALTFDGKASLRETADPHPGRGEALIRVSLAGICATDLEILKGYSDFRGILGHEFVGVVRSAEDSSLVGERVVGEINCPCRECSLCREGLGNHCPARRVLGIWGKDGAFANYLTLPQENLHRVPQGLSDEEAVFTEPLASCYQILEQVPLRAGERVIVLGDGRLGLLAAQVLEGAGARVALLGHHEEKLSKLKGKGISTFLDAGELKERADLVVEATGSPRGLVEAMSLVRPRGRVVLKSTYAGSYPLNLSPAVIDEVTLLGSRCGPFPRALKALDRGEVDVRIIITESYSLREGLRALEAARRPGTLKVLIRP